MEAGWTAIESKHFRLEPLADGVWAAIHRDGGHAIGNAGIIDLGDRTLVYDAMISPRAGADLCAAAEALTGRPVDFVIDSHWHNDHIWGNQAFEGAEIIATDVTRSLLLATRGEEDFDGFMAGAEAALERAIARYEGAQDERQRRESRIWVDYWEGAIDYRPILQVRAPTVSFAERLTFHGSARSAELVALAGHTASDAVLFLPEDGIAFVSDLLFVGMHPYLGDGDPEKLVSALGAIAERGPRLVVPGHGEVGTPESLAEMRQYVLTLDAMARDVLRSGQAEDVLDTVAIPAPFDGRLVARMFRSNLHFLYQRARRAHAQ